MSHRIMPGASSRTLNNTSLARLRRVQGRIKEARELLAPVYDRFIEGFETADLRAAKALIGELREPYAYPLAEN
jgi:predicted ATPase